MKTIGTKTIKIVTASIAIAAVLSGTAIFAIKSAAPKEEFKTEQTISSSDLVEEYENVKNQVLVALTKDDFEEVKRAIKDGEKKLSADSRFKEFKTEVDKVTKAYDLIKTNLNKPSQDWAPTLTELESVKGDDILVNKAKALINQIKVQSAAAVKEKEEAEEKAELEPFGPDNPIDMTDIPIVDGLNANVGMGTIYPMSKRGNLVPIIKDKMKNRVDDPYTWWERLSMNLGVSVDYDKLTQADLDYLNDLAARIYVYYVGSDFCNQEWIANFMYTSGFVDKFLVEEPAQSSSTPTVDSEGYSILIIIAKDYDGNIIRKYTKEDVANAVATGTYLEGDIFYVTDRNMNNFGSAHTLEDLAAICGV